MIKRRLKRRGTKEKWEKQGRDKIARRNGARTLKECCPRMQSRIRRSYAGII
jgi:hypothetical protein